MIFRCCLQIWPSVLTTFLPKRSTDPYLFACQNNSSREENREDEHLYRFREIIPTSDDL